MLSGSILVQTPPISLCISPPWTTEGSTKSDHMSRKCLGNHACSKVILGGRRTHGLTIAANRAVPEWLSRRLVEGRYVTSPMIFGRRCRDNLRHWHTATWRQISHLALELHCARSTNIPVRIENISNGTLLFRSGQCSADQTSWRRLQHFGCSKQPGASKSEVL